MTDNLLRKIERAVKLIQSAAANAKKHGQPIEVCYSGGKDSDVILELAKMAGVDYRAIYKNTTIDPPGTIAHAKSVGAEILPPKYSFRQLLEKKGMPNRWRRFCCGALKEYKVLDYAIIGIRREESRARRNRYKEPEQCRLYRNTETVMQYFPILVWSADDVANFIAERGIRCHPLYYDDNGKFKADRRLGCLCCPLTSQPKRIAAFKEHPKMMRLYIRAAQRYLKTHPDNKIAKYFSNPFDWFVASVFCDGTRQFHAMFDATPLFGDDKVDTKRFLEQYFDVKL